MPRQSKTRGARAGRSKITELQEENEHLKQLVATLVATLLKNATSIFAEARPLAGFASTRPDLVEIAEDCGHLAQQAHEIAKGLENIVNVLTDKAVALETMLQREKWKKT